MRLEQELTYDEKVSRLKTLIMDALPSHGQLPMIVLNQARSALPYRVDLALLQEAYDSLFAERKVWPEQDFSITMLARAYKF